MIKIIWHCINRYMLIMLMVGWSTLAVGANAWVQVGSDIIGENPGDESGYSVSLSKDGKVVAIGAPSNSDGVVYSGHVRVFQNISDNWIQVGSDINGLSQEKLGHSVSLSSDGTVLAIGAPLYGDMVDVFGKVKIYKNVSGIWTQVGSDLFETWSGGRGSPGYFGIAVSLNADGTIVAVGNYYVFRPYGKVSIYENVSGIWTQIGSNIYGIMENDDRFGSSISLSADGTTVAIGAPGSYLSYNYAGYVRVYKNISGVWTQIGADIKGEKYNDRLGSSVSINSDGSVIAIGSPNNDDNGGETGSVKIYQNVSGTWTQIGADIDGDYTGENLGSSVSLNSYGTIVAVGASGNNENGVSAGQVKIFRNVSGTWCRIGSNIEGDSAGGYFGNSVSLSGDGKLVAVGAPNIRDSATKYGKVKIFNDNSPQRIFSPGFMLLLRKEDKE